jgi:hypothetical protein
LNYQQFLEIWSELFAIFETINIVNPPDLTIDIGSHWKSYKNFTETKIYGPQGELIGSETCYFILPCDVGGVPLVPSTVLIREWRNIRQYLSPPTPH